MPPRLSRSRLGPSSVWGLWTDIRVSWRLLRDPAVPWWAKAVLPLTVLYLLSPLDLIPDMIIGIGEIDDLLILYAGLKLFLFLCPRAVAAHHREAVAARRRYTPVGPADVVIDADYRRDS